MIQMLGLYCLGDIAVSSKNKCETKKNTLTKQFNHSYLNTYKLLCCCEPSRWAARSNWIHNMTILSLLYFSDIILGWQYKIKLGNGPLQPVTVNNSTGTVS